MMKMSCCCLFNDLFLVVANAATAGLLLLVGLFLCVCVLWLAVTDVFVVVFCCCCCI